MCCFHVLVPDRIASAAWLRKPETLYPYAHALPKGIESSPFMPMVAGRMLTEEAIEKLLLFELSIDYYDAIGQRTQVNILTEARAAISEICQDRLRIALKPW